MIFNFCYPDFSDEEWIYIITKYLKGFTEIPLSSTNSYNIEDLKFYDGLIGTLLKHTEEISDKCPQILNREFIDSWKYQGKLYRIIHSHYIFDNEELEPNLAMPVVDYHRMITHWTDDFTFKGIMDKLSDTEEYIILEADTKEHFAFDVNKFRKSHNCEEIYTMKEREIIFPMYEENIVEYRMTVNNFVQMKKQEG
ncbi:MAG: hypothetical protein J6C62_02840 [Clostridia bacterium]|nr:hypothetical protein [Clostridia bacterium]